MALSSYTSIANKSSFFFNIDSDKKAKNLQVVDPKAPGNKHRHLSVILPHEHIHIQHLMDTSGLTKDKLYEIYAWHQIMIDMHIAKIRPDNLEDLTYVPKHLQHQDPNAGMYITATNKFFDHYHRFREPKNKYIPQTWQDTWLERENAPTTEHFDHDRGTKYDVEWTNDMKFPIQAERLGEPEFAEDPFERILSFERAQAHPGYQY